MWVWAGWCTPASSLETETKYVCLRRLMTLCGGRFLRVNWRTLSNLESASHSEMHNFLRYISESSRLSLAIYQRGCSRKAFDPERASCGEASAASCLRRQLFTPPAPLLVPNHQTNSACKSGGPTKKVGCGIQSRGPFGRWPSVGSFRHDARRKGHTHGHLARMHDEHQRSETVVTAHRRPHITA